MKPANSQNDIFCHTHHMRSAPSLVSIFHSTYIEQRDFLLNFYVILEFFDFCFHENFNLLKFWVGFSVNYS